MSKKTIVTLVDDLDGTDAAETIAFAVDGAAYEIDLSADNAAALRAAFEPYVKAARRSSASRRGGRRSSSADSGGAASPKEIRAWAADNGVDVPARGRIPAGVHEQFLAAKG